VILIDFHIWYRTGRDNFFFQMATKITSPENSTCLRSIFWTNVTLLGFDPSVHATGSYSVIKFDRNMFTQGPSSVKAMELITWFLFNKLDNKLAESVRRVYYICV